MHLIYYDEVKYDPPHQPSYWLGGICVPHKIVPELEAQVGDVALAAFGSSALSKENEFHGIEICRGKGAFKGRDLKERLDILSNLLSIIAREDVARISIKVNPGNLTDTSKPPADIAFMFLVEKTEELLKDRDSLGMLFGDYDEPAIGTSVANLSAFRLGGTGWAQGQGISHLIDTVHFAKSHHSRMVQLADIYLYCEQFWWGENTSQWRKAVLDVIRKSGVWKSTKYKDWPTQKIWHR